VAQGQEVEEAVSGLAVAAESTDMGWMIVDQVEPASMINIINP
jgi:hypothetical protein